MPRETPAQRLRVLLRSTGAILSTTTNARLLEAQVPLAEQTAFLQSINAASNILRRHILVTRDASGCNFRLRVEPVAPVVCAWCTRAMAPGDVDAPVSHGICPTCARALMAEQPETHS